jgi:NTE family protein
MTGRDRLRRIAETARATADSVTPANLPADPVNGPRGLRDPLAAFREQDTPDPRRQPVALVLAGGGARGAYQAGVVRYLADVGTPVTAIAGASIGAINGAVLAGAPSLADGARRLRELWRQVAEQTGEAPVAGDPADPVTRLANLPHHLRGPMLRRGFLDQLVTDHVEVAALRNGIPTLVSVFPSIDPYLGSTFPAFVDRKLHGPMRARGLRLGWAVDCVRGYVLRQRSEWIRINELAPDAVHHAVLASAALPILLPPRAVGGRAYRDGGLGGRFADNVPVGALCDVVGCDRVVIVHLEPLPLVNPNEYPGLDIIEVMPSRSLGTSGPAGWLSSLLDLAPSRVAELDELGYADARQLLGDRWEREAAGQVFRFMAEFRHDAVAELDEPVDG